MTFLAHDWTPNVVGGVDTPKRLYHGTSLGNARSIVRHGLEVRGGPDLLAQLVEPPYGVYLAPDWWPAQDRAQSEDSGVVLVVKVKGLPLVYCRTMFGTRRVDCYVSLEPIDAGRIVKAYDTDGRLVWRRPKK